MTFCIYVYRYPTRALMYVCSFQVVVMTFCEGFKVTDAEALAAAELDREGVMRKITESFAYQVSEFSFYFYLYRFTPPPPPSLTARDIGLVLKPIFEAPLIT